MENVNAGGTIYVQDRGFVGTNMNGFLSCRHMVWPLDGEFHCNCLGALANSGHGSCSGSVLINGRGVVNLELLQVLQINVLMDDHIHSCSCANNEGTELRRVARTLSSQLEALQQTILHLNQSMDM
jgi:hypothetical protein